MPAKPIRFSLGSLFFLPLFVSPLLVSSIFIRDLGRGPRSTAALFNVLFCTAVYATILTARKRMGCAGHSRYVLPAIGTGVRYGLLCMAQIVTPLFIAIVFAQCKAQNRTAIVFLQWEWRWVLEMAAMMVSILAPFGAALGALGGSAAGLAMEWHASRRQRTAELGNHPISE